jgi:glycosyltransferase 2 family protein
MMVIPLSAIAACSAAILIARADRCQRGEAGGIVSVSRLNLSVAHAGRGWKNASALPRPGFGGALRMRRVETIFIALAALFYVWFLTHYGPGEVIHYVRLAGWGLVLTISLESVARFANTLGWRVTITDYPRNLSLLELFAARIGGEAVDYTTPSAQLGGQFVMALAVRQKLRMPVGLATVVVAALAEALGQIGFITLALLSTAGLVPAVARLMWPIAGGFALALALAAGFFFVQTRRPFAHLWRAAARFDFARIAKYEVKAAADEADSILLEFYTRHRVRFALSCLCYLFAWSLGPIEIYILLRLLHEPASVQVVLLVEALGLLIERATFLVPAKLISQEGGKALILAMLGYPAGVGFVVGFLRRVKEMVWVLLGLICLALHRAVAERPPLAAAPGATPREPVLKINEAQGEQSL